MTTTEGRKEGRREREKHQSPGLTSDKAQTGEKKNSGKIKRYDNVAPQTYRAVRLGPEDLRRNVSRSPALRRHETAHHAAREPEVRQLDVGVVVLRRQQQVLGLQIAVHDAEVVAVAHGVQQDAAQVARLLLVVVRLHENNMARV